MLLTWVWSCFVIFCLIFLFLNFVVSFPSFTDVLHSFCFSLRRSLTLTLILLVKSVSELHRPSGVTNRHVHELPPSEVRWSRYWTWSLVSAEFTPNKASNQTLIWILTTPINTTEPRKNLNSKCNVCRVTEVHLSLNSTVNRSRGRGVFGWNVNIIQKKQKNTNNFNRIDSTRLESVFNPVQIRFRVFHRFLKAS